MGLSPERYSEALSQTFRGGTVGDGRSKQLFFYSRGGGVIAKTINSKERKLLGAILPSMVDYLTAYADTSSLPRFYGCFRIKSSVGFSRTIIVMSNVFPASAVLEKKFDLKGSICNRYVSPEELERGCSTLKDANFSLEGLDPSHRTAVAAAQCAQLERHRLTHKSEKDRSSFIEALERDVRWLQRHGLIDYSLLVGFCNEEQQSSSSEGAATTMSGEGEKEPRNLKGLFKRAAKVAAITHHIAQLAQVGECE